MVRAYLSLQTFTCMHPFLPQCKSLIHKAFLTDSLGGLLFSRGRGRWGNEPLGHDLYLKDTTKEIRFKKTRHSCLDWYEIMLSLDEISRQYDGILIREEISRV